MSAPAFVPRLPPRVGTDALDEALRSVGGDLAALLVDLDLRGGVLVGEGPEHGTCTVTFARPVRDPRESAVLLIDTITHMRRDRLDHFVLDRRTLAGADLHVGAFVLPRGLRATTALLVETDLDIRVAEDRATWRAVYARTTALSTAAEVVHSIEGGTATVLALPGAVASPHTDPEATGRLLGAGGGIVPPSSVHHAVIDSAALGVPMRVTALVPDAVHGVPTAALLVADGDRLTDEYPLRPALDRLHEAGAIEPTLVLMFSSVDRTRRAEVLGMNPALAVFLEQELLSWAAGIASVPADPARRALAGASLGGLSAADVVRRTPEVVANAIVQSGSFWWPAEGADGAQLRLWQEEGPALAGRVRVFQEVGDQEGHLRGDNRAFRDIARAGGVDVAYREYVGGHDLACWRVGVLDALVHFFPAAARTPVAMSYEEVRA